MSLDMIRTLMEGLPSLTGANLKLLRFEEDPKDGAMLYTSRAIDLDPSSLMDDLLEDIKTEYTKKPGRLGRYTTVDPYDGTMVETTIYSLERKNSLIAETCDRMITSLAHPLPSGNPLDLKANAYVLQGDWTYKDSTLPVKLISLINPFKKLKHKFLYNGKTFHEIAERVLDLRLYMNVIIIGERVYFFGMEGEKLFGMERAYRTKVSELADEFGKTSFLTNVNILQETALSGHYPRMLVAYQSSKMKYLEKPSHRKAIAKKFGIALDGKDNFDMGKTDSAGKLIRFLCNKGMLDPTDEAAMEVAGAKRWT